MIIIIEGIDRVGKTTLAKMLSKELGYTIFKDNPKYNVIYTDRVINSEKINLLLTFMELGVLNNVIIDRGHFTEYVYGKIDRHYTNNDVFEFDERLGQIKNLLFIYVKPEDINFSSQLHGSDLTEHDKLMTECIKNSKIKNIITTSWSNLQNTVNEVKQLIMEK